MPAVAGSKKTAERKKVGNHFKTQEEAERGYRLGLGQSLPERLRKALLKKLKVFGIATWLLKYRNQNSGYLNEQWEWI